MNGKFVGLFSAAAVAVGLSRAASAVADPNEEQQIRWSEEAYLLHGSYARRPRQVSSTSFGADNLLRSVGYQRDGDLGYFQLSPKTDDTLPVMFAAVDLDTGAVVFQRSIPPGADCAVDPDDHVVHCGGWVSNSQRDGWCWTVAAARRCSIKLCRAESSRAAWSAGLPT